ncbi:Papain family cysteine protease [Carpediemonas membranifera]|uniref:Papain family cysteine protease n=1 Tax=Carpediemonas membranifera TaxID=201153 RepID=A0A8J6E104_9EUKA|nr:Papain family cysteine protease [Carpediemonas membranifera]|eukprot:KAG9395739.1 Papain family cysteine protease [Carpediemonas membranifera]
MRFLLQVNANHPPFSQPFKLRPIAATGESVSFSSQWLLSCAEYDDDWTPCEGINYPDVYDAMKRSGIVSKSCLPYDSRDGVAAVARDIQKEIFLRGPVSTRIDFYDNMFAYRSGIYTIDQNSKKIGSHAIRLIGWGIEHGIPYWLCTNTWGRHWGIGGAFKIRRGVNAFNVEMRLFKGRFKPSIFFPIFRKQE